MQREKKTEIITLRVTPRTKAVIQERAKSVNKTVTDYLCLCGLGKEIVQVKGLDKVLSELKAQGRNLNQLTTLVNMGKVTVVYGDRLAESYRQVSEQLRQLLNAVNGAPARAQRSGSCGERRHPGMSELSADKAGSE
ncbi:plasmid mobilization relaxosome protein MobC [uncultured Oscillibacter sp.]|uniref:plasmid mobilization protein n=1 Tax=uncultured Oscillibacter sp. TaxID=876091 RepID=UPI0028044040|nr:plasmid mobilization relaxosome protein MobC [uncultured Oscillibacter sp.]